MNETTAFSAEELYAQIQHQGPTFYPSSSWNQRGLYSDYVRRDAFVQRYAWALPSAGAIHDIVQRDLACGQHSYKRRG
jgi:hypothetical protein